MNLVVYFYFMDLKPWFTKIDTKLDEVMELLVSYIFSISTLSNFSLDVN